MDYSDYLWRKVGKTVYADYHQQQIINDYICSNNLISDNCYHTQLKPKSFSDAYNIAQGSSTGGCSYESLPNGRFTYTPKCAPNEYTNITGSAFTEFGTNGSRGIFIIYSNDGTPLYSFKNNSYIDLRLTPSTIQIGSLYTSTNYYTNMVQTLSNWEPADIQPNSVPSRGVAYTSWSDLDVPLNTIVFGGEGPGGVYNKNVIKSDLSNTYFLNILDSSKMNIYSNGNNAFTIDNGINRKSFVITVLNDNIGKVWSITYPTNESLSSNNTNINNIIYANFDKNIKITVDTLNNMYIIYNHKMDCNNSIYQSDNTIANLSGILGSNDYSGSQIIKYDQLGYATWGATALTNYDGYTRFIRKISTDSIAIASRYYSNTYFSNSSYSVSGRPLFYNSNGTTVSRPNLPATSLDLPQHFVATYSSNGNFRWASAMSCPSKNQAMNNMMTTDSGSVYVCGRYESNNYFYDSNGTLSSISNVYTPYQAGYLAKFNSSGTPQWALSFTVNYFDSILNNVDFKNVVQNISIDTAGNIYAVLKTGTCNARIYSNNTLITGLAISNLDYASVNALAKINTNGQIQWISAINPQEYMNTDYSADINIVSGGKTGNVGVGGNILGGSGLNLICYNGAGVIKLSNTTHL